uniref:Uncharacterized protein n=1 Tax=Arundo donax TaxID=35708 RepID=A0A0A9CN79_ARUDO
MLISQVSPLRVKTLGLLPGPGSHPRHPILEAWGVDCCLARQLPPRPNPNEPSRKEYQMQLDSSPHSPRAFIASQLIRHSLLGFGKE